MASTNDGEVHFTFQYLEGKKFLSLTGKEAQDTLMKWSMQNRLRAQAFSFDQPFQSYQKNEFALAFMQDPNVIYHHQVVSSSGKPVSLSLKAQAVKVEQVSCSLLSMSIFDRLYNNQVVRDSGCIIKCFDEYYEDIAISDELRKMLLVEDSDNYDLYSRTERDEFLFRLFKHICIGGAVCQYEDEIQPYLDATKLIYKDLISVQKDPKTSDLHVISLVFKISASEEDVLFYPACAEHEQNFAYLIVDPLKHHVNVLYHKYGSIMSGD